MLTKLERRMDENCMNFNKELENKKQTELKNTINEILKYDRRNQQ